MEWFDVTRDRLSPCSNLRPAVLMPRLLLPARWRPSMLILFDHGTPAPLIPFLEGHTVTKAKDAGWDRLVNGELLKECSAMFGE